MGAVGAVAHLADADCVLRAEGRTFDRAQACAFTAAAVSAETAGAPDAALPAAFLPLAALLLASHRPRRRQEPEDRCAQRGWKTSEEPAPVEGTPQAKSEVIEPGAVHAVLMVGSLLTAISALPGYPALAV